MEKYRDRAIEIYKPVLDKRFPDCYEVSNFGNIRLIRTNKITSGYTNNYGYKYITSKYNKKRNTLLIHILVAKAFIPNPENKPQVNHKNGIKTDNRVENLEWCSHAENMQHAVKTGLVTNCTQKGENHNTAKHAFKVVEEIRNLYKTGKFSMRKLAQMFNTSPGYISDVINNKIRINI